MDTNKVLAIPESALRVFFAQSGFYTGEQTVIALSALRGQARLVPRQIAEGTATLKQVVSYGIVRNADRILCLRRAKTSNRSSLRLRYTVLFGGHVDEQDMQASEPLGACILRELEEELGVVPTGQPRLLGVVADPSTEVGLLHIGFLFDVVLTQSDICVAADRDSGEFVGAARKARYTLSGWEDLARLPVDSLDPWSRIFLATTQAEFLTCAPVSLVRDAQLPLRW